MRETLSGSRHRRRQRLLALGLLLVGFLGSGQEVTAESSACKQARVIVEEVSRTAPGISEPQTLLGRLATARDLCPSLGEAWKASYCLAKTLGDSNKARIYADRAVFNGIANLECSGENHASPDEIPKPELGPVHNKYALIVGIGSFLDERIPKLRFTAKDARDFRDLLVDPRYGRFDPDNVLLLVDSQASRAGILEAVQQIYKWAKEDDLVVIYMSTHGSPRQGGLGLQGIGHIVTYDTNLDSLYIDALEFQDFSEKISLIPARRKVTFLDTCFSGQAFAAGQKSLVLEAFGPDKEAASLFLSGEGSYVVTSSSDSEQSWESDSLQNSYFTYFLIEALRSGPEPPTIREVWDHLAKNVSQRASAERGAQQHPQLHPEDSDGSLRIGVVSEEQF